MKNIFSTSRLLGAAMALVWSVQASAVHSEIGLNYGYKKSYFDKENNVEQQSVTGSLSFYFWERVALELAYTNGLYVKKEKQPNSMSAFLRETTQYTDVYEGGLIFVFADRKAPFQPYVKGGAAYVKRKQVVQDDGNNPWEVPYSGTSPSYGIGFKFFLTQEFAIRASYDILETPVEGGSKVNDINGRIGISWVL
ncbi:MAG: outer membrane beta-barrel protein [Pseudobdellovibrionaceae bacterium]|jgi:hypothetical protein